MQMVDLYVETDSKAPKSNKRMTGYLLDCPEHPKNDPKHRFYSFVGTYNQAILDSLTEAMGRLNQSCEVHIHTQDTYVMNMIERNLPLWAGNEFRNAKGELIKNHSQWSELWSCAQKHLLVMEPGTHSFYQWMQEEMKKEKPAASSIS